MAEIALRQVTGAPRGGRPLVRDLSLRVASGEVLALLGPSGAGKSTILRLVAGLEDVVAGEIALDGARVDDVPAHQRDLAFVTQDQSLLDHLDVEGNIGFGLRLHKVPGAEILQRVRAEARVFRLTRMLRRRPGTLSAGEQQAAALARATVRVPRAYLLDEPLARLDAPERLRVRAELGRYVRGLGVTTLLATNDQADAMAVADRVAVVRDGRLEQVDVPERLYREPANAFVAAFVGDPGMAIVQARLEAGGRATLLRAGRDAVEIAGVPRRVRLAFDGEAVLLGVRPEHWDVVPAGAEDGLRAAVLRVERPGATVRVVTSLAGTGDLVTVVRRSDDVRTGDALVLRPHPDHLHLFEPATGEVVWRSP